MERKVYKTIKMWWYGEVSEKVGYLIVCENFRSEKMAYVVAILTGIFWLVRYSIGKLYCHYYGHGRYWVDESYGNPERGGDGGYCKRCGYSFWHQYY